VPSADFTKTSSVTIASLSRETGAVHTRVVSPVETSCDQTVPGSLKDVVLKNISGSSGRPDSSSSSGRPDSSRTAESFGVATRCRWGAVQVGDAQRRRAVDEVMADEAPADMRGSDHLVVELGDDLGPGASLSGVERDLHDPAAGGARVREEEEVVAHVPDHRVPRRPVGDESLPHVGSVASRSSTWSSVSGAAP
jgi:hypothetical protein